MALRDQPYLPLYVQDYLTDEKLNECSAATQGVYIKIMCLMHKSETYGKILLRQKYWQTSDKCQDFATQLVNHLPFSKEQICSALTELLSEGVCYVESNHLCQKRMIRDNYISETRKVSGSKGGFAKAKDVAKSIANTENENEYVNEDENEEEKKRVQGEGKGLNIPFEKFWDMYDKKEDRQKCEKRWSNMTNKDREACIKAIPSYISSTPDKKYRKNPSTYLYNSSWENEIISPVSVKVDTVLTYDEILKISETNPDIWKRYKAEKKEGERKAVFIPITK